MLFSLLAISNGFTSLDAAEKTQRDRGTALQRNSHVASIDIIDGSRAEIMNEASVGFVVADV